LPKSSTHNVIGSTHVTLAVGIIVAGFAVGLYPQILYLPIPELLPDIPEPKRSINVSSLADLTAAIDSAIPGDQIVLRNGEYSTTKQIKISARGTAENPIVITAETLEGAVISGSYGFYLAGSENVIIKGFRLTYSQDNSEDANRCHNCVNVRFTSNVFALTTRTNNASDWLAITGTSNGVRVDNNTFQNKSTMGNFLILVGDEGRMVQNTRVDHNVFSYHTYAGPNGGECVEVGNSSLGPALAYTVIEHNLFDNCNGDAEALSIKSSHNTIRFNTFRNSQGSVVLRHGSDNVVDGNIFLAGDSGIRVYGANQLITNNYVADTSGYPIVVGRATVPSDIAASNAEYSQARNIIIVHNTLVNNEAGVVVGAYEGSLAPVNITVANNIVTSISGILVHVMDGDVIFANNILYPTGTAIEGEIPAEGYTKLDPLLQGASDILRPTPESPAIDAVPKEEEYGIATDVDGQVRNGLFDIGADELV
jgi:poly(beta-D-mannuronate) lyase